MKYLTVNNLMCIQFDPDKKYINLVLRDGDNVYIVDLGDKIRLMTADERVKGDHIPEQ